MNDISQLMPMAGVYGLNLGRKKMKMKMQHFNKIDNLE
jgi:hypothetical protein